MMKFLVTEFLLLIGTVFFSVPSFGGMSGGMIGGKVSDIKADKYFSIRCSDENSGTAAIPIGARVVLTGPTSIREGCPLSTLVVVNNQNKVRYPLKCSDHPLFVRNWGKIDPNIELYDNEGVVQSTNHFMTLCKVIDPNFQAPASETISTQPLALGSKMYMTFPGPRDYYQYETVTLRKVFPVLAGLDDGANLAGFEPLFDSLDPKSRKLSGMNAWTDRVMVGVSFSNPENISWMREWAKINQVSINGLSGQ